MFEASGAQRDPRDAREVANYVHALELGLELLNELPLCIRLINRVHQRLLLGVRGEQAVPGELRTGQVWIAPLGTPIHEARFIPPPANLVPDLLADWERYVNEDLRIPPLVQCALMHYQFEAIHPYFDGNGRIGRLLIILFLCTKQVLPTPLLYLSAYFERNRDAYYDRLYDVSSTGNWQAWLEFFLEGVAQQARDAVVRSRRVRQLQQRYRDLLQERHESGNAFSLLDELFANPFMTAPRASAVLGLTPAGARRVLERLAQTGIVEYVSGAWPRLYVARELLQAIENPEAAQS